jgi:hypothetical protein
MARRKFSPSRRVPPSDWPMCDLNDNSFDDFSAPVVHLCCQPSGYVLVGKPLRRLSSKAIEIHSPLQLKLFMALQVSQALTEGLPKALRGPHLQLQLHRSHLLFYPTIMTPPLQQLESSAVRIGSSLNTSPNLASPLASFIR